METKMLRALSLAVLAVVAIYTTLAWMLGWSWSSIFLFDFWAYQMVFLSSAYMLYLWDDRRHRTFEN